MSRRWMKMKIAFLFLLKPTLRLINRFEDQTSFGEQDAFIFIGRARGNVLPTEGWTICMRTDINSGIACLSLGRFFFFDSSSTHQPVPIFILSFLYQSWFRNMWLENAEPRLEKEWKIKMFQVQPKVGFLSSSSTYSWSILGLGL